MATAAAQVSLNGRFSPGTVVELVEVADESVLRSAGGRVVDTKKVSDDGTVCFKSGVKDGGRYFIRGVNDGFPLEVRARGRSAEQDTAGFQAPVQRDRQRLADGSWLDEPPAGEDAPGAHVGPAPSVQQARGERLRSSTARGYAHPVGKDEEAPYPAQEDRKDSEAQRSSTVTGQATPVAAEAPASQQDVPAGTAQRSDTPLGQATPIPDGDAVDAMLQRESAETKASTGEPVKAAAFPPDAPVEAPDRDADPAVLINSPGARKLIAAQATEEVRGPGEDGEVIGSRDGLDGQGQPAAADVAAGAGVEPAKEPAAGRSNSKKEKK